MDALLQIWQAALALRFFAIIIGIIFEFLNDEIFLAAIFAIGGVFQILQSLFTSLDYDLATLDSSSAVFSNTPLMVSAGTTSQGS